MKFTKYFTAFLLLLFLQSSLHGQIDQYLINPSFEGEARQAQPPRGWKDCSFSTESPVDVHSAETNIFSVQDHPEHGDTFLGMVTRDNGTYEGVSTELLQPLLKDSIYEISAFIKQTDKYYSLSRARRNIDSVFNYDAPTVLEVWISTEDCQEEIILFSSPPAARGEWQQVSFKY